MGKKELGWSWGHLTDNLGRYVPGGERLLFGVATLGLPDVIHL